jgi:hypothetical protein
MRGRSPKSMLLVFLIGSVFLGVTEAFSPLPKLSFSRGSLSTPRLRSCLFVSLDPLPEISGMKLSDMRSELDSYDVSTVGFLEKVDFEKALKEARAQGKKPKKKKTSTVNGAKNEAPKGFTKDATKDATKSTVNGAANNAKKGVTNGASDSDITKPRAERLQEAKAKAKEMSLADLRKDLAGRGISTKSFFEKTDFINAYATAVVDGAPGRAGRAAPPRQEEVRDPDYRDVVMTKLPRNDVLALAAAVIDVTASPR